MPGGLNETQNSVKKQEDAFWQQGNFPPLNEEVTQTKLKVEGTITADLNGYYYRNGPNNWKGPSKHFFFGDKLTPADDDCVLDVALQLFVGRGFQ